MIFLILFFKFGDCLEDHRLVVNGEYNTTSRFTLAVFKTIRSCDCFAPFTAHLAKKRKPIDLDGIPQEGFPEHVDASVVGDAPHCFNPNDVKDISDNNAV